MAKKLTASRVRSCLSAAINISDAEAAELATKAGQFPGDETEAYVAAVEDKLVDLRNFRAGVMNQKREAEVEAAKAAVAAESPYANAEEAWDDMAPDNAVFTELPEDMQNEWRTAYDAGKASGQLAERLYIKATPAYASVDEAWEDNRPKLADDLDIALFNLPKGLQLEWMDAVASNKTSQPLAADIFARAEITITALDEFNIQLKALRNTVSIDEFKENVGDIIETAFFESDPNKQRAGITDAAQAYVNSEVDDARRTAITESFLEQVNAVSSIKARVKGKERPWYSYAKHHNLIGSVTAKIADMPAEERTQYGLDKPTKEKEAVDAPQLSSAQRLANLLRDTLLVSNKAIENAEALYDEVNEANELDFVVNSFTTLRDYFTEDGDVKTKKVGGVRKFTHETLTVEEQRAQEDVVKAAEAEGRKEDKLRAADALAASKRERGAAADTTPRKPVGAPSVVKSSTESESIYEDEDVSDLGFEFDRTDGEFSRDDGTPITKSVDPGKIRLLVNSFISKLFNKPKVFVYKNLADLKARNPELYARAKAARTQGDFDTIQAVGYSFGRVGSVRPEVDKTRRRIIKGAAGAVAMPGNLLKLFAGQKAVPTFEEFLNLFDSVFIAVDNHRLAAMSSAGRDAPIPVGQTSVFFPSGLFYNARLDAAYSIDKDYADFVQGLEAGAYDDDGTDINPYQTAARNLYEKKKDTIVDIFERAFTAETKAVTQVAAKLITAANKTKSLKKGTAQKENGQRSAEAMPEDDTAVVIIFSDFVRTEQHLKFVLAHETLGHFGFKGVIPEGKLAAVLTDIYEADPDVRAAVEVMMATRGMSKLEAVEEYVSDYAAYIDNSILMKIWNVLANFLNKLGLKFNDDMARYLINQSRKYVRSGGGKIVTSSRIMSDMSQLAREGRYRVADSGDLLSASMAAGSGNSRAGGTGGLAGVADAFNQGLFGVRKNVPGKIASILEHLQTLDYKARRSYGLKQLYMLFERQQQTARKLLSKYNEMMKYVVSPTGFGFGNGVTEEDKQKAGELLSHAALLRGNLLDDARIKKPVIIDGVARSLVTRDAFGNISIDNAVRAELERQGMVSIEEFRNGFDIKYDDGLGNTPTVNFRREELQETDPEWKIYKAVRATVNEAAIDLMLSNYEAALGETTRIVDGLNDQRRAGNVFSDIDLAAIREAARRYQDMRYENSDVASAAVALSSTSLNNAEAFLISFGRAMYDDNIYNVWTRNPQANPNIANDQVSARGVLRAGDTRLTHASFQDPMYDSLRAVLPSLRERVRGISTNENARKEESYRIQKTIRDLSLFDLQSKNSEFYAKRTILGAYVPFTRRGKFQVRLTAVDANGNPMRISEQTRSIMPYFQFETEAEAAQSVRELTEVFGGGTQWTIADEFNQATEVRFVAGYSKVRSTPDLIETVNYNEFVFALNRLNISINPRERERVVTALTEQNARARKNLQRSGNPGWNKDVVRGVSEHIETTAHVAAKRLYKHRINDVLLKESNWRGDRSKLDGLKRAVDRAANDTQRARARKEYDEYAYMYQYMADVTGETVEINGKQVPTLGRGMDSLEDAKEVINWYSNTGNITDSTEDILSGDVGSQLKLAAVLFQLGGSVASAVINLVSLGSHSIPYLSFYNAKTAFGGGYGFARSSAEIFSAMRALKNVNFAEPSFIQKILDDNTFGEYGLTRDETEVLLLQTQEGSLQAAQFNSLVGTARGKVFNNKAAAAIRTWMSMFSYTEQLNRRTTALAAYRLGKERALANGMSEVEARAVASEAARTAVNTSQGEYAMFNRSKMARGDIMQFVFMYKQFVIITIELLKGMDYRGRALSLGLLLLASGMKGLPFGEDILDIIDTIAQKLGLTMGSVEKELLEFLDGVAPGLGYFAMNGVMNRMTGSTFSTRLGLGDIFPLTGAMRAGADPVRELTNFAGPVVGAVSGAIATVGDLTNYAAEVAGVKADTTSFSTILRNSPISALRALSDAAIYMDDGRITNARGQIVSNDVTLWAVLSRAAGFYPAVATEQNDVVRMSRYIAEYGKEVKASFVTSYVKAKLNGDRDRMREIVKDVAAWNVAAKGQGTEISKFVQSANRSAREIQRPTAARYRKSAPSTVRPQTDELLRFYGIED